MVGGKLPLNVREWTCDCGMMPDRDVNAARTVPAAVLAASVCGDGVIRPQREASRRGGRR
jgi:putative transposase